VDDGSGCAGIDSVFIDQPAAIDVDLNITQPLCYGYNTGAAIVDTVYNYTGTYNQVSYFWNPNPSGTNGLGADSLMNLPPGTYALTINDDNGCSNVFDFTIAYPDSLYFVQLGTEPASCRVFDWQIGHGVVYAAASGDNPNYSYEWTNLTTGATSNNTTWGGLNPGNYQILVTDTKGCTLTAIVTVEEMFPNADFEMTSPQFTSNYFGTAVVDVHFENLSTDFANPNDPNADTTFFWNFDDGNPWILSQDLYETFDRTYTEGGTFDICLVAINSNGCTDTVCKPLVIYNPLLFVPVNIFTPDEDNVNDVFTFAEYAEGVAEFSCLIVNRWGVKMHEMDNITDAWDGTDMNGDVCHDGVYFYTYQGKAENGTPFEGQGTIQIVNSKK
jgi:gliding motility-associated-like protein